MALAWCPEGDLNPHRPFGPADFKSAASANFAIRALGAGVIRGLRQLQVILPALQQNTTILRTQLASIFHANSAMPTTRISSGSSVRKANCLLVWCCEYATLLRA